MKTFKYLLSLLFMAGATLGFTACGDDDSDPAGGKHGQGRQRRLHHSG